MTNVKSQRTYSQHKVEDALNAVPREQWSTSGKVSTALLTCNRSIGIARNFMLAKGVALLNQDDIMSEVALIMQMKMVDKLVEVKDVYFVIYRVCLNIVSNYGRKPTNTTHSQEVSLTSMMGPEDNENDALDRLNSDYEENDQSAENEDRIDLANARRRFSEMLAKTGWPADIKKDRIRIGRPLKQKPIIPASPDKSEVGGAISVKAQRKDQAVA